MKLTPTLSLALTVAAGIAGTAAAQTATNMNAPPSAAQPTPSYNRSPANTAATQPAYSQPQSAANERQPAQPATTTAQTATNGNEEVRQAQQELHATGLYNGPVDGVMDPDTRAAIARFQQQNGLPRTENLDQATLSRLMSGQTTGYGSSMPATGATRPNAPGTTAPSNAGGSSAGTSMGR